MILNWHELNDQKWLGCRVQDLLLILLSRVQKSLIEWTVAEFRTLPKSLPHTSNFRYKKPLIEWLRCLYGAGTKSRTRDLLITSQLLYQLSYAG